MFEYNTMPFDIQQRIWKAFFSNIVLKEFNENSVDYDIQQGTDYGLPVDIQWCLKWHSFIPFQPSVSGQRQRHLEYAEMEDFEGTKHAEYSKKR